MAEASLQFVLIHGSWMDGSAWDQVAEELRAQGHKVFAPTLAGHGKGVPRCVTHADIIRKLKLDIEAAGLDDFVLLGHSFGGTILQQLAMVMPERIRRLVFWNAFVVPDGESLNDQIPGHFKEMFDALGAASADGAAVLPFPVYREAFFNDGSYAEAHRTHEMLYPEYLGLFDEKLSTAGFFSLQIPKSYLYARDDASLPHGDACGWYPRFGNRLGLFRYVSMPGGHMAHWTCPSQLAAKIIEAGRD